MIKTIRKKFLAVFLAFTMAISIIPAMTPYVNAAAGDVWTTQISGTSSKLNGVCYGGSTFVAVGDGGTILTSSDGSNWTNRTSSPASNATATEGKKLNAVCYGNGIFLAVGAEGKIMTSSDGITWTAKTSLGINILAVAYGLVGGTSTFVLTAEGGSYGYIFTSINNGDSWTVQSEVTGNGAFYNAVCYGGGLFVACGDWDVYTSDCSSRLVVSSDGEAWMDYSETSNSYQSLLGVCYGNSMFVAAGAESHIITSSDGTVWTYQGFLPGYPSLNAICFGGTTFMAVGYNGTIAASTDAASWNLKTSSTPNNLTSVCYGNNTFVAVGDIGTVITSVGVAVPTVATGDASSVTSAVATLNGSVNANGASSTVTFEYGTSTSYGSTATAAESPVTGTSATSVSCVIAGLSANTTYHYRIKAENSAGTTYSSDSTFTTSKKPAVTLMPDATDNDVDHDIVITFTHDSDFEAAISGVSYNGTALTATTDYIVGSGTITLKPGGGNAVLRTATDSKNVIVTATAYDDSGVPQTIMAGAMASLTLTAQPSPGLTSGLAFSAQPVVTLKDQYGNVCSSGVSASADVVASVSSKSGLTGSWTIGGTTTRAASSGVAAFTDLTCTLVAAGTGAINFACGTPAVDSDSFTIPKKSAVTLTPDTTDNDVDHDIVITFTHDSDFEAAISGVSYDGTALTATTDYIVGSGTITLKPDGGNAVLTTAADSRNVVVTAPGYNDSSVSQAIMAGAVASLTLTAQPSPGLTSGLVFSTQPVVTLKDQYGNVCSSGVSASADVVASVSSKSGLTGSWTIGGTTAKAASSGVATFTDLTCSLVAAGTGAISFACGTPAVDSNSFAIPKKSAVTLTPDMTDNDVDHEIVITFTHDSDFEAAISGVSYNGTALTATTDYIVGSGTITLKPGGGNAVLTTAADSRNVIVTAAGYNDSSVSQTIMAGAVASLTLTAQPSPGSTSGLAFSTQPVVTLKDQYGNVCSSGVSASADVVASVSSKSGLTGSWTIGGTTAKAASSGVATFTDLTCTLLSAGTGAINFACGTPAVDSNSFTIPKKSAVTLTPDMTDNDVDHDIVINFTHDSDFETAISGVSYNGTALTATTDYIVGSGTITLKPGGGNAALTTATDNKNVVVTAAGYNDSSVSQTIMAGAVASLTLTAQPSPDSTSGLAFSTQPVVTLKDQYGNVCSSGVSASADVVASVSSKSGLTGSWTIGGMTTRAASSGVATFTDLTCTLLGTGTGAINFACGTPAIDSDSFTIPKKSAVTLTPDTMDNDVDHDIVISFTHDSDFETAISGVSYNGTALTATKDYIIGSGMITLKPGGGNAALTTATDSRNIIVTAPGYNDSSVSQTITAGAVASLTVTTQPSPDSTSGLAFSTQPVVTLKDQYGNVCSSGVSASADVVASVSSKSGLTGSWTIGGMTTKAASSGVATFTDLTCTLVAAGTGAINFACGTPAVDSNSFTIPKKSAVALTPDMTDNDVDHDLNITFTADSDFAAAITGVTYNGNMLNSSQYTVDTTNNNMITLHPGIGGNTYLRTPGNASLTIIAAGYNDSSVSQTIMAGAVASLTLTAQPSPASTSGLAFSTQPVVTLKDQYGNVCSSGVSASADVVASVSSKSGLTGSWTIGGMTTKAASSGVATFTDLTCTLVTAGTGAINFACGTPAVDSNSFTIPKKTAVTLIPDTTDNDVDHDIVITFTHDSDFETAISGVSYNGTALTATTDYIVGSGTITLKPGGGNKVLRTASDSKNVIVKATGYGNSGVIQTIKSGTAKSILITTQPVPGSTSGDAFASQPVVKIVDQYGNTCTSGLSATLEVRAAAKGVTGSWTIGGTTTRAASSGIATFTDLTCTLAASGTGKISFSCNGGGMSLDSNSFTIPERNSSIMPTSASFDRYSGSTGYVDIAVIMTLNSNTLNAVKNGTATLIKGTDYTVSSDTCTISRTYLAKLTKGTAQFTFDFNFGADPVLSITITDSTPSDGGNGGEGPSTIGNGGVNIIVNGQSLTSGTSETTTNSNGQTTTTVTVDTHKLESVLDTQGMGATVTIPVAGGSDVASGVLTGDIVKTMETKDATLEIRTDSAVYTVPASEININAVSSQLGTSVTLSDIKVNVSIGEPADATFKVIADAASKGGYTVQVPAVDFTISCTYNGQTVNVSSFNSYVERMVSIPKGVDPNKITTGVVVKPDGTAYHVPTQVVVIGGVYYAKINSLTNSTYTVVWHPVEFTDMDGHWAKNAVNDMGSRMVIDGVGNNNFEPDRKMTRAEFASIIVKALGLAPGIGTDNFNDVTPADWFFGYVKTATKYGIIEGYNSKTFGPNDLITREQAMTMITRAMKITGLTVNLTDEEINGLLKAYSDSKSASSYAKRSIATCLQTGIVEGKDGSVIAPKSYVTRAEVAVMAQRLLQKSKLI